MNTQDVLNEFRDAGALREGHFVLSSGLHSAVFLQKNLVFMDGARCERLCKALAEKIVDTVGPVDVAISPAVGGIIPGYETAKHRKVRSMYVEREGGAERCPQGASPGSDRYPPQLSRRAWRGLSHFKALSGSSSRKRL